MMTFKELKAFGKQNRQDIYMLVGAVVLVLSLFLWGMMDILNEVKIDDSYQVATGKVISTRSHLYVIKYSEIEYYIKGVRYNKSIQYSIVDGLLLPGDIARIRIYNYDYTNIALDRSIGNRIIPHLFIISIGLLVYVLIIPAYRLKIKRWSIDHAHNA